MNIQNKKGFSLLEILITTVLLAFVTKGVSSMSIHVIRSKLKILSYLKIEKIHSEFQYILSKNEACSKSLRNHFDGSRDVEIYLFEDEKYDKFIDLKESQTLQSVELKFHEIIRSKGYGSLVFSYKAYKQETIKKIIRVPIETKEFKDGIVRVKSCLTEEASSACPAETAPFLTSFNESTLSVLTERTLNLNTPLKDRLSGKEHIYIGSSLSGDSEKSGTSCINYNLCMQGEWLSRSLCYDSCRNKFWSDGMLVYGDKNEAESTDNESYVSFICPNETFNYASTCAGQSLDDFRIKRGSYASRRNYFQSIKNTNGEIIGNFQASFTCTYAGTWAFKHAECREKTTSGSGTIYRKVWDLNLPGSPLTCPTSGKTIIIKSHDKTTSRVIALQNLYKNRVFNIGDPRRLIISFEGQPTSATIVCERNGNINKWKQLGESIKNCEGLNNPKPRVDIIFVVDNSGSMGDNQASLSRSINQFINKFFAGEKEKTIKYTISVITTDFRLTGSFTKTQFKNNRSSTIAALKRALKPGTGGSGAERPIGSASNFLHQRYSSYKNSNYLAILFVTDESNAENSSLFIEFLKTLKNGDETKLIIYGALTGEETYVRPVINHYAGKIFDVNNLSGYGTGLAKFAEEITKKVLVFGN